MAASRNWANPVTLGGVFQRALISLNVVLDNFTTKEKQSTNLPLGKFKHTL